MACANCAALRERVHELERELGLRMIDGGVAKLRLRPGIQPMTARALLVLYQARGYVSTETMVERGGFANSSNLRTRISLARRQLGKGVVLASWGQGYLLGPEGRKIIEKALAA